MEPAFWLSRWEEGQTAFHREEVHPHLVRYARSIFAPGGRVLVPLCGATLDLRWLADAGWPTLGVELSPLAVERLAERDGLEHTGPVGPFERWEGAGVVVLQGDAFALTPELTGPVSGIWDRAALVALHPDQRTPYVELQRRLLGAGTLLLSTVSYDPAEMDGPPWSVDRAAVGALWPEAVLVESVDAVPPPRFQERGLTAMSDQLWWARLRG